MKRIFKIIKYISKTIKKKLNPVKYAKTVGVIFPDRELKIYGNVFWGSEPWIITLGKNVHITNNVMFITHDGGTLLFRQIDPTLEITKPITLGDNVYVGINTIILPGVNVGSNVIIGAGSVVTKDIPSNVVVAGNPAKIIKSIDTYFEKIKSESIGLGNLVGDEKDKALRKYYGRKQ